MQQRFSAGATTDTIITTQGAGVDGVWGTADDFRTAETHCQYASGPTLDKRVLLDDSRFSPELLAGVSSSLCWWRRPVAGTLRATIRGEYVSSDILDDVQMQMQSSSGAILFDALGYTELWNSGDIATLLSRLGYLFNPLTRKIAETVSYGSVLYCGENAVCEETGGSITFSTPCLADDGLDDVIYTPFDGISFHPIKLFNGTLLYANFLDDYVHRTLSSDAIQQSFPPPYMYNQYDYDSAGRLALIQRFNVVRISGVCNDVLVSRAVQEEQLNGWRRTYYNGAGEDDEWGTMDEAVDRIVDLTKDAKERIGTVKICRAAGDDGLWATEDDRCETLTLHYQ